MSAAFEAREISKTFGAVRALQKVTLDLRPGEVHAIIGENGAGKSTLMNIICGKLAPTEGGLFRNGEPATFHSPLDAQRAGISIAPQEINLAPKLSVAENILLGHQSASAGIINWKGCRRRAQDALHQIDDTIDVNAVVDRLSKAQQQLVQIARAVATSARILIFDEPTAALTNRETEKLYGFIRCFRDGGGSIFYISHRLDEILDLSDRISCLQDGRLIGELDPATASKQQMIDMMAGREVKGSHAPRPYVERGEVVLRVEGLSRAGEFSDVSFELHKGEILGVAGLIGAGRTELGKCLFGVTRPDRGRVEVLGETVLIRHPADAIARGFIYLPEERKAEGIFPLLSINENAALPNYDRFGGKLGLRFGEAAREVSEYVRKLRIKIASGEHPITSLSGGNQQKVILARWLMRGSKVLILDEPTRGIDVNAKFEIQAVLRDLCDQGLSILYISSELLELLEVSDRILVMHEGCVKGVQRASEATQESLLQQAMLTAGADQGAFIHSVKRPLTVVFIPKLIHPWYEAVKVGATFAADELKKSGVDVNLEWDPPPLADVADHNKRIEANIAKRPDALVVACLDPATNAQILDEAVKGGLNVITFNSFCADRFPFVGQKDSYQDGYDLGEYLADQIGDKGEVGILSGSLTAQDHARRVQGFKAAITEHPGIKIVFELSDNDDLDTAVSLTESALQAHPRLVGVFGCNASNPIGAARAVKKAGLVGKVKIVGLDDLPETIQFVKEGVITATMVQRQWEQGYWAVMYAVGKNEGHTIPMTHETGSRLVTKDNVSRQPDVGHAAAAGNSLYEISLS